MRRFGDARPPTHPSMPPLAGTGAQCYHLDCIRADGIRFVTTINIKMPPGRLEQLAATGFKLPAVSNASISEHSTFEAPLFISGSAIYGSRLNFGAFNSVAGARFGNTTMGRYCSIGEQVAIGQHEHPVDWLTSSRISHVPDTHKWNQILSRDHPERMKFRRTPFTSSNPVTVLGNDV